MQIDYCIHIFTKDILLTIIQESKYFVYFQQLSTLHSKYPTQFVVFVPFLVFEIDL